MPPVFTPADYFRELRKEEIFADASRPLEIDLGCGDGAFLVEMARRFPERDFLGVERLLGRARKVAKKIQRAGLANARVLRLESGYCVGWLLPAAAVSRLHLLCPDPWPKKRHHKNRLINNTEFLSGLQRILAPGGEFLLKTDHAEYFEDAVASLGALPGFHRAEWIEDEASYPRTDFEDQWLAQGRSIHSSRWVFDPQPAGRQS